MDGSEYEKYMRVALKLASKGRGRVNPNPMVGAVLVRGSEIIAVGFHESYGAPHAERNAIDACRHSPEGSTLFVTLEPCCHHGKTPPCTDAIIECGVRKVVIGVMDPNPLVAGKGIEKLRDGGVEVVEGVLEAECRKQNEVFFHYIEHKTPFVVMKYAMTMDGKAASRTGKSKWITGKAARRRVHQDRNSYSAVMVGIGTVIEDDPLLNCRIDGGRDPVRVICDTNLRTPIQSQIVMSAREIRTIIATTCTDEKKHEPYLGEGCSIVTVGKKDGRVNLNELMTVLGNDGIDSILLEGGGTLNWSAISSGIVNKVQAYIAPKILGGANAKPPVAGLGAESPVAGLGAAGLGAEATVVGLGEVGLNVKSPVAGLGAEAPDEAFYLANSSVVALEGGDFLIESDVVSGLPQGTDFFVRDNCIAVEREV